MDEEQNRAITWFIRIRGKILLRAGENNEKLTMLKPTLHTTSITIAGRPAVRVARK